MKMKRNKLLAFVLSLCLTVGLVPSLAVNAEVRKNNTVKVESKADKNANINLDGATTTLNLGEITTTPFNEDMLRESKGVKSKAVLKIARMLLKGPGVDALLGVMLKAGVIDSETALAIGANCYKLSAYLEKIANYGEDAAAFVKANLPSVMVGWGVDSGIAQTAANGLSWAIRCADWIFG